MKIKKTLKKSTSRSEKKTSRSTIRHVIGMYWIHITIIAILVTYGINRQLELRQFAQSCMTRDMVTADSRCLYIYQNHIYEKGSRNNPHKGNACGTDVTSFIPSFHFMSAAVYLDPNLKGTLCSDALPTSTPTPTTRPTATLTPTTRPSATPTAQQNPTATPTLRPTITVTPSTGPTATPTPLIVPTDIPTPTPTIPTSYVPSYPTWWTLIPQPLRDYLEILYYWVFYVRRPSDNAHILEGVFPTPTP